MWSVIQYNGNPIVKTLKAKTSEAFYFQICKSTYLRRKKKSCFKPFKIILHVFLGDKLLSTLKAVWKLGALHISYINYIIIQLHINYFCRFVVFIFNPNLKKALKDKTRMYFMYFVRKCLVYNSWYVFVKKKKKVAFLQMLST